MTAQNMLRVLLVEDSKTDALLIKKSLTQAAPDMYAIHQVSTVEEALHTLSANVFNVILLDLSLPDTSGFAGLSSILHMCPATPVIMLTGLTDEDMAIAGVAHGAQDYLFKDQTDGDDIKRAIKYAIQRKQLEGSLMAKANFDQLTGLANRAFFENRLDMAIAKSTRTNASLGVFFLDLDRFKQVNDTMGHAAGDLLLQMVAERIKKSLRPYDTAARFGGDEFAVLTEDIHEEADCSVIAQKIIQQITEPFHIEGKATEIGVSIGITTNKGDTPLSREALIQQADKAMYMAKMTAGSCYQFYGQPVAKDKKLAQ